MILTYIRHVAGEMENDVQYCVVCGAIICDYRNTREMFSIGSPHVKSRGFAPGPIFVRTQGRSTITTHVIGEDDNYQNCKP